MKAWTENYKILSDFFLVPDQEDLKKEHTRLFSLTVAGGVPPYETEYGHKDIFFKTQRLADIAGFYRAFGMEIADGGRIDFIGAELELMHWIALKEKYALEAGKKEQAQICQDAAVKFMLDHLGRWGSYFGDQLTQSARHPFYQSVGRRLSQFIEAECRRLDVQPERVTGWNPEPISTTEFECGGNSSSEVT